MIIKEKTTFSTKGQFHCKPKQSWKQKKTHQSKTKILREAELRTEQAISSNCVIMREKETQCKWNITIYVSVCAGKSYGVEVPWMDSTTNEANLWCRMLQSNGEWVEDILPLRMLIMAKSMWAWCSIMSGSCSITWPCINVSFFSVIWNIRHIYIL